ncbi:MAG TPA: periplasmic heavy metal sensor [Thermoanaerobaculia bacterium]|nr:periplasmic heavy metal sensor [Thermoanaerobaculia bacterium]
MKKTFFLAIVLAAFAASAFAQLPPGKWWRRPDIVTQLELTADQQEKLDTIFRASAADLIDLRGAVEKENIAMRGELDQPQLNRANIQRIAARLNEARGHLFQRELAMLVDMRGVLSDQQWNRMRAELDQLKEQGGAQRQLPRKMRQR